MMYNSDKTETPEVVLANALYQLVVGYLAITHYRRAIIFFLNVLL